MSTAALFQKIGEQKNCYVSRKKKMIFSARATYEESMFREVTPCSPLQRAARERVYAAWFIMVTLLGLEFKAEDRSDMCLRNIT
jgi:hypothetical protein